MYIHYYIVNQRELNRKYIRESQIGTIIQNCFVEGAFYTSEGKPAVEQTERTVASFS
jgi:hypothetical protein